MKKNNSTIINNTEFNNIKNQRIKNEILKKVLRFKVINSHPNYPAKEIEFYNYYTASYLKKYNLADTYDNYIKFLLLLPQYRYYYYIPIKYRYNSIERVSDEDILLYLNKIFNDKAIKNIFMKITIIRKMELYLLSAGLSITEIRKKSIIKKERSILSRFLTNYYRNGVNEKDLIKTIFLGGYRVDTPHDSLQLYIEKNNSYSLEEVVYFTENYLSSSFIIDNIVKKAFKIK